MCCSVCRYIPRGSDDDGGGCGAVVAYQKKRKKNPSTPGRDFLPLIPGEIKGKSTVQSTRHR